MLPAPSIQLRRQSVEATLSQLIGTRFHTYTRPALIAIGGPGGTGKTRLCERLATSLNSCSILSLDDYRLPRKERQAKALLGSHPEGTDMALLRDHLAALRHDTPVQKPVYNTQTGEVDGATAFSPSPIILLDGEISTYEHLRDMVDMTVYVDAEWRTQLKSRLSRDIDDHGFTPEKALSTFIQSNIHDADSFGKPGREQADIVLFARDDYSLVIRHISENLSECLSLPPELKEADFAGLIVPVPTPFTAGLAVDEAAFVRHLHFLAEHQVERVLIGGTIGEFFSLSGDECRRLLQVSRHHFPGVILFQAGRQNSEQTLTETRRAEDLGADAVVVLPPYYYAAVGDQGLIDYFHALEGSIDLPLVLYNFTRHTQNRLSPEVLNAVRHFGLKDSDADLSLIPHTPRYYLGSDSGLIDAYRAGAFGFVCGSANFLPADYVALEQAIRSDSDRAEALQERIDASVARTSGPNSIIRIKSELTSLIPGYPPYARPPLR